MAEIPLRGWKSPRTYVQGVSWWPTRARYLCRQARNVRRQKEQDQIFHWHRADGAYICSFRVPKVGHCSSCGVQDMGGTARIWMRHATRKEIGWVEVLADQTETPSWHAAHNLPVGDPAISPNGRLLCIRRGNRFTTYRLSDQQRLSDIRIPAWGKRFQGHDVMDDGAVLVHRDVRTKGPSRAHAYDRRGRLIKSRDTRKLGDEAECFVIINGLPRIVKRTGGNNARRRLQLTIWNIKPKEAAPMPKPKTSKIPAGVIAPVKRKCAEVVEHFPQITHVYGYAAAPSDHKNRKCIDFMVYDSTKPASQNLQAADRVKLGDAIASYIWANRKRLDLVLIIWNRRILRTYDKVQGGKLYKAGTWAPYTGSNPHTDHPHVEFGDGAYVPPPATPQPADSIGTVWMDRLVAGVTDSTSIRLVQRALKVPETGTVDAATVAAVRAFQASLGDTVDGWLGPKQTRLLMERAGLNVTIRTDPS